MARLSPLYTLMTVAALSLSTPLHAQSRTQVQAPSQNNAASCQAFANLGGIVADFILPMSLRDFAAMNGGQAPQRVQAFVSKIDRELNPNDKQAFSRLGQENSAMLEEAATEFAIDLVLDGHASSRQGVRSIMSQECTQVTAQQIIEIQRQSHQTNAQTR